MLDSFRMPSIGAGGVPLQRSVLALRVLRSADQRSTDVGGADPFAARPRMDDERVLRVRVCDPIARWVSSGGARASSDRCEPRREVTQECWLVDDSQPAQRGPTLCDLGDPFEHVVEVRLRVHPIKSSWSRLSTHTLRNGQRIFDRFVRAVDQQRYLARDLKRRL